MRLNALGAYALGPTDRYAPSFVDAVEQTLKVLANLDVVVTGELLPADRLMLEAYAARTGDRVRALREASLLAVLDAGRGLDQFRQVRTARALTNCVIRRRRCSPMSRRGPGGWVAWPWSG